MDKTTAQRTVRVTFKAAFDRKRYRDFINELCNGFDESKAQTMRVPDAFLPHVKSCQRLGTFESADGELADVLIVHLTASFKLERTRTALRDFVAHKLKREESYKEAGLVAFVTPDAASWRFSFVRMEYETKRDPKTGKIKAEERLTPARRHSYLVGLNEECHTAQSRFLDLLQNTTDKPALAQIETAFSVESVSIEFFAEYVRLFEATEAALVALVKKDKTLRADFEAKHVNTADFTKKLLGQIVFLYFIQKKGWLGVQKGGQWGDGPHNFLRQLATQAVENRQNLFNDVLEPLFYDTLATDRGLEAWCKPFHCRIPFLNGGLFEPLAGYDWEHTAITLPNSLLTNHETNKAGDIGTGILDVFDRFNFTVVEDEPLEKEVAIDPEMLGKVFENLIEENRRKGLGAFYTPREIVHYMCQESLINYLDTALNHSLKPFGAALQQVNATPPLFVDSDEVPTPPTGQQEFLEPATDVLVSRSELAEWIGQSEQFAHYATAIATGTKGDHYPKPPAAIRQYAREIDALLRDITVCDPAVGSGAFLVGMMTEIVRARLALTPYFTDVADRTAYHFKRRTIQYSLYGVDIDAGAVEIAKLRLWLSLVVDEEDVQQIQALPNLDYKIVAGNSLLGVEKNLFNQEQFKQLELLKPKFFNESDRKKKAHFKKQIDDLIHDLTSGREVFDFDIYFSEVFHANGGFDVVIANPPYIGQKNNNILFQEVKQSPLGIRFHQRRMDYFYFFFHVALDLAKPQGNIAFITTNYFLTATYADKLRKDINARAAIRVLINFNELKIFESALGQHNIITILSNGHSAETPVKCHFVNETGHATGEVLRNILYQRSANVVHSTPSNVKIYEGEALYIRMKSTSDNDEVGDSIFDKISAASQPLGLVYDLVEGIHTGADKVSDSHLEKFNLSSEKGAGIYILSEVEVNQLNLNAEESDLIKPWFKNSDIKRWVTTNQPRRFLIYYTTKGRYQSVGSIQRHLSQFKPILVNRKTRSGTGMISTKDYDDFVSGEKFISYVMNASAFKRGDYYCVSYPREQRVFEEAKIVVPQRSSRNTFAYNDTPWYASADVYFILKKSADYSLKYLLGLLNSKLFYYWLYHKGKRKGQTLELYIRPLSEIPIKRSSLPQQWQVEQLVDLILAAKQRDTQVDVSALESQLNKLVYAHYDLTPDEIGLVEAAR